MNGGDIVDQVRDWFGRMRERISSEVAGVGRSSARYPGRRSLARAQAVPFDGDGPPRAPRPYRDGYRGEGTFDRLDRNTFTLLLAGALIVLVVILFLALSWVLGYGGSSSSAKPTPTTIPLTNPGPAPKPAIPPPLPSPSPQVSVSVQSTPVRVHVVESGDTLNRIAAKFGVTVDALMQANNITDRNKIIRIGDRMNIPEPVSGAQQPGR